MGESRTEPFVHPALYIEDIPTDVLAMYREYLGGATILKVAARHGRDPAPVGEVFAECGLEKRTGSLRPSLPLSARRNGHALPPPRRNGQRARNVAANGSARRMHGATRSGVVVALGGSSSASAASSRCTRFYARGA